MIQNSIQSTKNLQFQIFKEAFNQKRKINVDFNIYLRI